MAFTHRQTRVGTRVTSYTRTDERQRLRSPELRVGKDGRAAGTMPMPMAQFPFRGEMIRIMGYRRRGREHFLCLSLSLSLRLQQRRPLGLRHYRATPRRRLFGFCIREGKWQRPQRGRREGLPSSSGCCCGCRSKSFFIRFVVAVR